MRSIKLLVHSEDPDRAIYWLLCEKGPKVKRGTHTEESGGTSWSQAETKLAGNEWLGDPQSSTKANSL